MRAIGLDFETRLPAEFDLPEPPSPGRGEVLLRIREVGLCGTDRELAEFKYGAPPPGETRLALGHEAFAEVVETGAGVSLGRGALVAPLVRRACRPACAACLGARRDLCLSGKYAERGIFYLHGYLRPFAVDREEDLVEVPAALAPVAVLAEPLSVVEKALDTARRLHPLTARSALIFGAGPVGLLAALACVARGYTVEIVSLEPADHPHARLAVRAGARYSHRQPRSKADLVLECSGAPAAARAGLDHLAPAGVLLLIGAADFDLHFPGIRTVMENHTIAGIVNASPAHFAAAVEDLGRFPAGLLGDMVHRRAFREWRPALAGETPAPKSVVVLPE